MSISEDIYLERDMVIANPNFELLLNDIPFRIVFLEEKMSRFVVIGVLGDLTSFYNTFEL